MSTYSLKQKLWLIALTVILLLALTACINTGDNSNGGDDPITEKPVEPPFYDLSELNYNDEYDSSDASEKGFLLFDWLNFNLIKYTSIPTRNPTFEIYYGEKMLAAVEKSPQGTVYSNYMLNKTGEYTIKVTAQFYGSQTKQAEFTINVQAGGYPDRVEFELLNAQRQEVQYAKGGESFILVAKVYSGGTLLEEDNEKFTSFWTGGEEGQREWLVEISNRIDDAQDTYTFIYACNNIGAALNMSVGFEVEVKNNYKELRFDYGTDFKDGAAALSAAESGGAINFMQFVTAKHIFENGEEQELSVNYGENAQAGTIAAFIKYDGDTDYHRYKRNMYDTSVANGFTNYIKNGTVYQLDPRKSTADIYLAVCYKEEFVGGYTLKYRKIDGSHAAIAILKTTPDSISVPTIFGREKPMNSNKDYSYTEFSDRAVTDDAAEVKIMVTENYLGGASTQHFVPNIVLGGEYAIGDYYYKIENDTGVIYYIADKGYFGANKAGESLLKIKSCFGDAEYTLKITVQNPVVSYDIGLTGQDYLAVPNWFCGRLDIAPYVAVYRNYYNNTKDWRRVSETESLKYYVDGTEKNIEEFVFRDYIYSISIRLFEDGAEKAQKAVGYSFYIMPDLLIEIDGIQYQMSEMQKVRTSTAVKDSNDKSFTFLGDLPAMTVELAVGQSAAETLIDAQEGATIEYMAGIDAYYVYYKGYYRLDGFLKRYFDKVLAAKIFIDRTA